MSSSARPIHGTAQQRSRQEQMPVPAATPPGEYGSKFLFLVWGKALNLFIFKSNLRREENMMKISDYSNAAAHTFSQSTTKPSKCGLSHCWVHE